MTFRVICVGEPPPDWTREQLSAAEIDVVPVHAADVVAQLSDLDPRGYLMNSFGPPDGPRLTDDVLDLVPQLELVTYMGASRELGDYASYVDPDALRRRGIPFTSTATPEHGVAEGALALLHALELDLLHVHHTGVRPTTRHGLRGSTLGIVGMGQLGHRVAELAGPLGMRLVYHSRSQHADVERAYGARRLGLAELFATADHISVHLPNSAPSGVIGHSELAGAGGSTLINTTSAPGLVDPDALLAALDEGRIRRAAIEGRYPSPYDERLRALGDERVLMLPAYTSWDTFESREIGWRIVVETYLAAAAGATIPHRLA